MSKYAAATALALLAAATSVRADSGVDPDFGSMSSDELFSHCICWDKSSNTFCGGSDFWRKPCQEWAWRAALWGIPAFFLFFVYVVFPFVFFMGRCLCNCLGGRKPSFGCCFPHDHACCCPVKTDPRNAQLVDGVRHYSNRAIFLTKFFFCVAFGVQIYYAVGSYITNSQVHNGTTDLLNTMEMSTRSLAGTMMRSAEMFMSLQTDNFPYIASGTADDVTKATNLFEDRVNGIVDVLNHIRRVESDQSWGRAASMYRIPSLPLALGLVAFACMLCNLRGAHLTITGGLMSWCAALVTIAFIVHMVFAQVSTATCNTYNTTFVPTLVNAIESNHGCNSRRVLEPIMYAATGFQSDVCNGAQNPVTFDNFDGLNAICGGSLFNCPNVSYICGSPHTIDTNFVVGYPATATTAGGDSMCNFPFNYTGIPVCTLANCAQYCYPGSDAQVQAANLMNYITLYGPDVEYLFSVGYAEFYNCTGIQRVLHGQFYDDLCNKFDNEYTSIAVTLLAQMINGLALMIVTIVGAKRFTKMNRSERERENLVYGLLLTDEEAERYAGRPIAAPEVVAAVPHYGANAYGANAYGANAYGANAQHLQQHEAGQCSAAPFDASMATIPDTRV